MFRREPCQVLTEAAVSGMVSMCLDQFCFESASPSAFWSFLFDFRVYGI